MDFKQCRVGLVAHLGYQQGLLEVKRDIAAILFSKVEELRSANPTCRDAKAANLVAHNLSSQTKPMQRELASLACYVNDSATTVQEHLDTAYNHWQANPAAYYTYGQSLAPKTTEAEFPAQEVQAETLFDSYVA